MGALHTVCCCKYSHHDREEKNAILRTESSSSRMEGPRASVSSGSDPGPEALAGAEKDWNPWRSPRTSLGDAEEDGELQAFLDLRSQVDQDTEEWEKLNYDIHTLRYTRREIGSRWRKILTQLGYARQVEALLCVSRQTSLSDSGNLERARDLLAALGDQSSLFPQGALVHPRYLYIMDRLVSLDSAEDFVRLAKEKYPRRL